MPVSFSHGSSLPLPREILECIAFELVAQSPLGPPSQLVPLLLTSRAVHQALSMDSGTPLYSRICRLKFDVSAVARRAFTPGLRDINGHLVQMCTLLKFLKYGDVTDDAETEAQFLIAYIAMLDNDGKNRAQLQHAGIEALVDRFVRTRLRAEMQENDMWPQASVLNSCALWLMWMFTTKQSLQRETKEARAEIIELVFPFLACPYRYPSAHVAASHFTLPINDENPVQQQIFQLPNPHGSWPQYHVLDERPQVLWYFRSNPSFLSPLISPAAKLLYWSRREANEGGFFRNDAMPATRAELGGGPGLTQEDFAHFNMHKVAKLSADVVWDWETVGGPVCRTDEGVSVPWVEEDSRRWDVDWWRARQCTDVFRKQPRWRMGNVYVRGMLSGLWQGVQFSGNPPSITQILERSQRSSTEDTENGMFYGAKPMFMHLNEHALVRTPSTPDAPAVPIMAPTLHDVNLHPDEDHAEATQVPFDVSLANAWIPGPVGSFAWAEGGAPLEAGVLRDRYAAGPRSTSDGDDEEGEKGKSLPMSTTTLVASLLPVTHGLPRKMAEDLGGPVGWSEVERASRMSMMRVATYETFQEGRQSVHERLAEAKEREEVCGFETYGDPVSGKKVPKVHPGCLRCQEREEYMEAKRARGREGDTVGQTREFELLRVEDMFSGVGLGKDGDGGSVFDVDFENDEGRQQRTPHSRSVSPEEDDDEDEDMDMEEDDGEDQSEDSDDGHPGVCDAQGKYISDPIRRSHDPCKVEKCDGGMEDVIITGGVDAQIENAWGKSMFYGRVRPWDGLIAILRVCMARDGTPHSFIIHYGYIYGGDTFVGNWKYAVQSLDEGPLVPQYECAFVASRRSV